MCPPLCHLERNEVESRDLRIDERFLVKLVRRSLHALRLVGMTQIGKGGHKALLYIRRKALTVLRQRFLRVVIYLMGAGKLQIKLTSRHTRTLM